MPGDFTTALPPPSDTEELDAVVNCLFSRQHSSIFNSVISFYNHLQNPKIIINKKAKKEKRNKQTNERKKDKKRKTFNNLFMITPNP